MSETINGNKPVASYKDQPESPDYSGDVERLFRALADRYDQLFGQAVCNKKIEVSGIYQHVAGDIRMILNKLAEKRIKQARRGQNATTACKVVQDGRKNDSRTYSGRVKEDSMRLTHRDIQENSGKAPGDEGAEGKAD